MSGNGKGAEPQSLLDKIWEQSLVKSGNGGPDLMYVDLHLVHEVTSPQAFSELAARGMRVRRPDRTLATMDHAVPTVAMTSVGIVSGGRAEPDTAGECNRESGVWQNSDTEEMK